MLLCSENVREVIQRCLVDDITQINSPSVIKVDGIAHNWAFDKEKVEDNHQNILDMLHQLPRDFRKDVGGGCSFLKGCEDEEGNQWTDLHSVAESLFVLGMAINAVTFVIPRELWSALPGGVPYLVINE